MTKAEKRVIGAAMSWYHWLTGGRGERQLANFSGHIPIYALGKACAALQSKRRRK